MLKCVFESAVFGIPNQMFGEEIVAYVVLASDVNVTIDEIRTHCLAHLPVSRIPKQIRFIDKLPQTTSGKIDRQSLRPRFEEEIRT